MRLNLTGMLIMLLIVGVSTTLFDTGFVGIANNVGRNGSQITVSGADTTDTSGNYGFISQLKNDTVNFETNTASTCDNIWCQASELVDTVSRFWTLPVTISSAVTNLANRVNIPWVAAIFNVVLAALGALMAATVFWIIIGKRL